MVPAYRCAAQREFVHLLRVTTAKTMCEEHDRLKADAVAAVAEARRVRRGDRDVSFQEDAELSREAYRRTDALLKHLLVGHDGEPCPDGDRPIVSITTSKS